MTHGAETQRNEAQRPLKGVLKISNFAESATQTEWLVKRRRKKGKKPLEWTAHLALLVPTV